jgi:hypothetical protein
VLAMVVALGVAMAQVVADQLHQNPHSAVSTR